MKRAWPHTQTHKHTQSCLWMQTGECVSIGGGSLQKGQKGASTCSISYGNRERERDPVTRTWQGKPDCQMPSQFGGTSLVPDHSFMECNRGSFPSLEAPQNQTRCPLFENATRLAPSLAERVPLLLSHHPLLQNLINPDRILLQFPPPAL